MTIALLLARIFYAPPEVYRGAEAALAVLSIFSAFRLILAIEDGEIRGMIVSIARFLGAK